MSTPLHDRTVLVRSRTSDRCAPTGSVARCRPGTTAAAHGLAAGGRA